MFLRKEDYFKQIQEDDLDVIIEDVSGTPTEQFLIDCEAAAIKEVQSYLSHRYDVAKVFKALIAWDSDTAYLVGEWVLEGSTIYTALTDNTNKTPSANPTDWSASDGRDPLMKTYLIDVTLYHVYSRINPRDISVHIMSRRDEAIKWLEKISKGDINADLPEISEELSSGDALWWDSETKRVNSY